MFGLRAAIGRSLEPLGAVTAGFLIAVVAEPAMQDDGFGASTIGRVIGTGDDRGAAAVLALIGVVLVLIGIWVSRSCINGAIDGSHAGGAWSDGDPAAASVTVM